jgi:hypothetical protein
MAEGRRKFGNEHCTRCNGWTEVGRRKFGNEHCTRCNGWTEVGRRKKSSPLAPM